MHVYDIEDAVDQHDIKGLEHAFCVLVDFPHRGTVDGARSVAKLDELLGHVSAGLQLDPTILPDRMRETVERVTAVTFAPETSYGHAALVVCEFRERWHRLYHDGAS